MSLGMNGLLFGAMSVFGLVFFVLVAGLIVFVIVKSVSQSAKNRNSPILTVEARVVTKRADVSGGMGDTAAHTRHYITFEVESGDRMELSVSGQQFGMLAEGDVGRLTFQGTHFVYFLRRVQP